MPFLFLLLFFVCIAGVIRPFKGLKRWHFGLAAFVSFIMVGVTAPKSEADKSIQTTSTNTELTPAEAAALEAKNAPQIARLKKEASKVAASDYDANFNIYKQLSTLAPLNVDYTRKASDFEEKITARFRYEDHPDEALTIQDFDWNKSGFGSIMEISRLKIRNDASFAVKDFTLRCVHQGNSGTDIDGNTRTLYEIVPANGAKTFRAINMGFISSQAATTNCSITSARKV